MTESTSSSLTTEQLAGAEAGDGAPTPVPSVAPAAGATTETPVRQQDAERSEDVALQGQASRPAGEQAPLLANNAEFLARWNAIQTTFVDEPREAVESADTLVAEVIRELARVFADERGRLESAWSRGTDVSTEDLRQALQRYRDFFHVLLRT